MDPLSSAQTRDSTYDSYRGLAILSVILIHLSGHFLHWQSSGQLGWYLLAVPNRLLQFAVPAFLMLSALTNSQSLLRNNDLKLYARKRLNKTLWPYLLCSLFGIAWTYRHDFVDLHLHHVLNLLLWGKGYFHLYFMVLITQLYCVLPLLVRCFRGRPWLWHILGGAVIAQLMIYGLNRTLWHSSLIGSLILWYMLPVALGLWLAVCEDSKRLLSRKCVYLALVIASLGVAAYAPLSLVALRGKPVNTFVYQCGFWVYTANMSLLLLAAVQRFPQGKLTAFLRYCGLRSFPIYLIHPFVIAGLDKVWNGLPSHSIVMSLIAYGIAMLFIPLGLIRGGEILKARWQDVKSEGRSQIVPRGEAQKI